MMFASISAHPLDVIFDQDLPYTVTKTFRLFSSFPLNEHYKQGVIVAKDGASFSVIGEHSLFPKRRQEINVPYDGDILNFEALGFVSCEVLDTAPFKVVEETFG